MRKQLVALRDELNRHLASDHGVAVSKTDALSKWIKSHQPFHWFVEFYGIIGNGGFDVILGNPPYVEVPKGLSRTLLSGTFKTALGRWSRDEDLCTLVVERSLRLLRDEYGQFGMILPLSIAFSSKRSFVALREVLSTESGSWVWSHFDRIPSALFGNEVRTRCTIALLNREPLSQKMTGATTSLLRWTAEGRDSLFSTLHYAIIDCGISSGIPKVDSQIQADVVTRLLLAQSPLMTDLVSPISFDDLASTAPNFPQPCVFVGGTAYNWFPAWRDVPKSTNSVGKPSLPARTAAFRFKSEEQANIVFALLCSSLGYWWWATASDGFNLKKWLLDRFPVSTSMIPAGAGAQLAQLGAKLRRELERNYVYKDNKGRIGNFFLPACASEVLAIDSFLGSHVSVLSSEFFEDIQNFNARFSRAEISDGADDGD